MRNINNYSDFILESKMDLILESKLSFSDDILDILDTMLDNGNDIADILLLNYSDESDIPTPVNFLDITDSDDLLSFMSDNKGQDLLKLNKSPYKSVRNEVKVGKVIRKILDSIKKKGGEIYIKSYTIDAKDYVYSDKDIEDFVNEFKATYNSMSNRMDNFRIVEGEDIRKWYFESNYLMIRGTLGNSCMRHGECQNSLDIYVENRNIKLLVLFDETIESFVDEDTGDIVKLPSDKVIGRALVWSNVKIGDKSNQTFMDRIYTINDKDVKLFEIYAKDRGWWFKSMNDSDENTPLYGPLDNYHVSKSRTIISRLNTRDLAKYPSSDTLKYYDWMNGIISNDEYSVSDNYYLQLSTINGLYSCEGCDGQGEGSDCEVCDGQGEIFNDKDEEIECEDCSGEGKISCEVCGNNGNFI